MSKKNESSSYSEKKFPTLKSANAYAKSRGYTWYVSTLVLKTGVDEIKEAKKDKDILVAMVGETNLLYYK